MKKALFIILLLAAPHMAFGADEATAPKNPSAETTVTVRNPAEKLNRGLVNIITSPIEIAKQVDLSWKEGAKTDKNAGASVFSGFFKGLGFTVMRMGSGIWDVVSFPFKTPGKTNYEPMMKPEFVLDKDKEQK